MTEQKKLNILRKLTRLSGFIEGLGWVDTGNLGDALVQASELVEDIIDELARGEDWIIETPKEDNE